MLPTIGKNHFYLPQLYAKSGLSPWTAKPAELAPCSSHTGHGSFFSGFEAGFVRRGAGSTTRPLARVASRGMGPLVSPLSLINGLPPPPASSLPHFPVLAATATRTLALSLPLRGSIPRLVEQIGCGSWRTKVSLETIYVLRLRFWVYRCWIRYWGRFTNVGF